MNQPINDDDNTIVLKDVLFQDLFRKSNDQDKSSSVLLVKNVRRK